MSLSVFLLIFIVNVHVIYTVLPPLPSFDVRVNALLNEMTDEEKVGQMTHIGIDGIIKERTKPSDPFEIDPVKLRTAIQDYKIGSIGDVFGDQGAFALDQCFGIISQIQDEGNKSRLSIPILYGINSIHGANYVQNSVLFPHSIALSATFNLTLPREIGKVAAHQTRAAGIPWSFSPVLDIG
jgi:beta-glucosidase